jgi:hypothetical protein
MKNEWTTKDENALNNFKKRRMNAIKKWDVKELDYCEGEIDRLMAKFNAYMDWEIAELKKASQSAEC